MSARPAASLARIPLVPAARLEEELPPARWELPALAGRLAELSAQGASAALTLAFSLVLDAQRRGEPAAWITPAGSSFYPPDAAAASRVSSNSMPAASSSSRMTSAPA